MLNIILILIDSLNKHFLGPYGGQVELAPHLNTFAKQALRFDNHYVGSLPCMPARREIFSGRKDFLWRPWGHLELFDMPAPRKIAEQEYKTQLITDNFHYWKENAHGYLESFQGVEMIRGHEHDSWKTDPLKQIPSWVRAIERFRPGEGLHYLRNIQDFQDENDFFPAKVFSAAGAWLEKNHGMQPYFLQIESYDVHEPFHCPEPYRSMWSDSISEHYNCWPPYHDRLQQEAFFNQTSPAELAFIRSQYLGKLTMVDTWFNYFLGIADKLSIWDDTVVIVTSDHGHDLGELRSFGKSFPHWDSHANIPLLIRYPGLLEAQVSTALTSTVDLYATLLEICQVKRADPTHSRSLLPILERKACAEREGLIYGTFKSGICCTDGEYVLMQGFDNDRYPLYSYTGRHIAKPSHSAEISAGYFIPGVELPVWKTRVACSGSHPSALIHRQTIRDDPSHRVDDPAVLSMMRELLISLMREEGAPPEQYKRLGLTG